MEKGLYMRTVTIKVRDEVDVIIEEMIKLGIARSKNHAYNIVIEAGLPKVRELIERKKKVLKLVREFLEKGLPYDRLPTHEDVEEVRNR